MIHEGATADGPSKHLSWSELACHDGTLYPHKWRVSRARPLALLFEQIREGVGGPISVHSAYRHLAYNLSIGSKKKSRHVEGRALDLGVPPGLTLVAFLNIILEVSHRPGSRLRGIGVYPTFVHIDNRPSTRLARWRGRRLSAEVSFA